MNKDTVSPSKFSIMIIDDHPIIHDGLRTLLQMEKKLSIDASASSATEAMDQLETMQPDLAIIDLSLGDSDGTYLIQKLHNQYPKIGILVYTMSEEKLFGERVATAGACGYVMKTAGVIKLKEAIYAVLSGEFYFSEGLKERILNKNIGRNTRAQTLFDNLSNREMDVFKLIGQGMGTVDIGIKLDISRNTVDTHRINIKNKLELDNGKALDRLAYKVIAQGKIPKKK
jgi:DNA-binding NarL/FixJ family response regulator